MSDAALWPWDELVAAAGGQANGTPSRPVTGFSIDTRTLLPGEVFVALTDQRDGHAFVPAAFERGAAAAVVRMNYEAPAGAGALLRVDDPLAALRRIAAAARARLRPSARVIAVTGSAGKTGTKEMLRACLATAGKVHAPEKSFNNHWGVPLTLARMPRDTDFAVIEIGMNHAGEIRPLTRLTRPHLAVVTNVLPVHVGNFEDGIAGVARAKAEIFEGLEPGGVAIIGKGSHHFETLFEAAGAAAARTLVFGTDESDPSLDAFVSGAVSTSRECPADDAEAVEHFEIIVRREDGRTRLAVAMGPPGSPARRNVGAVALVLAEIGRLSERTLAPLADIRPTAGRGARSLHRADGGPLLLIDDSYNANPASMSAALGALGLVPRDQFPRRIAILGDMRELGRFADQHHLDLAPVIESHEIDLVLACGPHMKGMFERLPVARRGAWALVSDDLVPIVNASLRAGDAVMVKGSLGTRMAPIVAAIRQRFPLMR